MAERADWLAQQVQHIKGLKNAGEQRLLLVQLYEMQSRTPEQEKALAALVKVERAAERARNAAANASKALVSQKEAERKARNHELYEVAGLLIVAGLVDTKTGKPTVDRGTLLGALLEQAKFMQNPNPNVLDRWKQRGDARLAEIEAEKAAAKEAREAKQKAPAAPLRGER